MKETIKQKLSDDVPSLNQGLYTEWDRGFDAAWGEMAEEIAVVLQQLDQLADVWGDEVVFRRCRDRLRELINAA